MLSANQIKGLLNQVFLHVDTGFCMLIQIHKNEKPMKNLLGEHGQKWVWPAWLQDSKIDFISKMNRWNKLFFFFFFCMLDFWVGVVKNGSGLLVAETLKSAVF